MYEWLATVGATIVSLIVMIIGGFVNSLRNDNTRLHTKYDALLEAHHKLEVKIEGEYTKKEDLRALNAEFRQEIREFLDEFKTDVKASLGRLESHVFNIQNGSN